jgi:hypothetical protein
MRRKDYEKPPRSFAYKNASVSIGEIAKLSFQYCNRVYGVELVPRRPPILQMRRKEYEEPPRTFAYKNAAVSIGEIA